jgi:putative glutathione S-transferase
MGVLINGVWTDGELPQETGESGQFRRADSRFRDRITADGSSGFEAEPNRYHLYVAHGCPWAHRTLIYRALKKLDGVISVAYAIPGLKKNGWTFENDPRYPDCTPDTVNGFHYLYQAYTATEPRYTGKVTVPALWDKKSGRIINNESSEIIRMLNSEFDGITGDKTDFYPAALRAEIDAVNERVYHNINNGVYRSGFAKSQAAYEEAYDGLFATLDELEERLAASRYLFGAQITEADVRLWVTLARFDSVYVTHFKANTHRIVDYPNLWGYARDLYQHPAFGPTTDFDHIKRHYYTTHPQLNPQRIVPAGPVLDWEEPHHRDKLAP